MASLTLSGQSVGIALFPRVPRNGRAGPGNIGIYVLGNTGTTVYAFILTDPSNHPQMGRSHWRLLLLYGRNAPILRNP